MNSIVCSLSELKVSFIIYRDAYTNIVTEENINKTMYTNIIDNNIWPVIARHLGNAPYISLDDIANNYKEKNNIINTEEPAQ